MTTERLEIIKWTEFQIGISALWQDQDPITIPIYNNPFGIIQYTKKEIIHNMIYFPCKYVIDNAVVGYISIYNLSNIHIRARGIFVLPSFRGNGIGHRMLSSAYELFPKSFYRSFILTAQRDRFIKHSKMIKLPETKDLYSEFSQKYLSLLYFQRSNFPSEEQINFNEQWIKNNLNNYGLGGQNNLDLNIKTRDWYNYFRQHKGNYKIFKFNLDRG